MQLLVHQPVTHYMYSLLYLCVCAPFSAPKLLYYLVSPFLCVWQTAYVAVITKGVWCQSACPVTLQPPAPSHNVAVVNRCICGRHCGCHCPLRDHTAGLYGSDVRLWMQMRLLSSWHNKKKGQMWGMWRGGVPPCSAWWDVGPPASCCFCCRFLSFLTDGRSNQAHGGRGLGFWRGGGGGRIYSRVNLGRVTKWGSRKPNRLTGWWGVVD